MKGNMKLTQFLAYYDDINPKVKTYIITGIKWGMWLGGIVVFLIFVLLKSTGII